MNYYSLDEGRYTDCEKASARLAVGIVYVFAHAKRPLSHFHINSLTSFSVISLLGANLPTKV